MLHTGFVRRFVLVQLQTRLGNTTGLVLEARDLDYNLLTSRFELNQVVLKGTALSGMPAPLRAQRIVVVIPVWRLLRGSLDTAQIRIDGLALQWITARNGKSNWPALQPGGGGNAGGPSIRVTSGELSLRDDRAGLALTLPDIRLHAAWNREKHGYAIAFANSGGELQWNNARLALDGIQLKSGFANGDFAVESLRLVSGTSQAEISGLLHGSPSRIDASGNLDLDMLALSRALAPNTPVRGRMRAQLSASGPLQCLILDAALRGEDLVVRGVPVRRPTAEATIDTSTGELQIHSLSAGLFSGQLAANGRLWIGSKPGRSEWNARLNGIVPRQAAAAFGYSGFPAAPVAAGIAASWPGMNWRLAHVSGAARSRSATLSWKASGSPGAVSATVDASPGDGSTVHAGLTLRLAGQALSGVVRGEVESLHRLGVQVEQLMDRPDGSLSNLPLDGAAQWSSTIKGTLQHPAASLELGVQQLSLGDWNDAGLHVQAEYDAGRIAISSARLAWAGQQIQATGEIAGLSADAPLQLDGAIEGASLTALSEKLGIEPIDGGALTGNIRIAGSIGHPTAQAALRTGSLTAYGQHIAGTSLDASWRDGLLTVQHLFAGQTPAAGAPGQFEASGSLAVESGEYTVAATGTNFRLDAPELAGVFELSASGEGTLADPVLTAQLTGRELKVAGAEVGGLTVDAEAANHQATVHLAAAQLKTKITSTIAMEGSWPFELELDARGTHLGTTPEVSFDAIAHAKGSLAQPRVESASANVHNLRIQTPGQDTVSDGPVEVSFLNGQVQVGQLVLKSGDSVLRVTGAMPLEDGATPGSLIAQGKLDLEPLSGLMDAVRIGGAAEVNATVTGSLRNWQTSGSATIQQGRFDWQSLPLHFANIAGRVNLENGVLRASEITGDTGSGSLKMEASVPLGLISSALPTPAPSTQPAAKLSAQLDKVVLSGGTGEKAATATLGMKVEAEATALSLDALRATIEFTQLEAKASNSRMTQAAPARITIAGAVANLEAVQFEGSGMSLKASGSMGLAGDHPLQLQAAGNADLAVLSALTPLPDAAGTADLDVTLTGPLSAPQAKGFVRVNNGSLSVPSPHLEAANIKLHAELDGERVVLKELTGSLNGGTFLGGGDLKFNQHGIRDANIFLKGKDTFAEFPAAVKTTSSLDLKLVSRGDGLLLEGQVEVQEGYYETSADLFSRSATDVGLAPPDSQAPPANWLSFDVGIVTKRPVEMDNNLGRIAGTAKLHLGGTLAEPRLVGALDLEEDGRLYFGDRTYYIERGTIRFLDGPRITPDLNIQAYTRTNDYTIRLTLTGDLKQVTTTFTSDPPLSRDDVIAVLLTGKTVAENRGVDLRALEATSLATGALNATLSSQLNRSVGVSRVSIQPGAVAAESNPGARITITQDFTRSLRLLYSMNLSDSNDQIWVGEYDLSRSLTTRAVKQSDNSYRGEFRHDIRFGSSTPAPVTALTAGGKRKISAVEFTGAGPLPVHDLAKTFKLKAGQKYQAAKARKGSERLSRALMKKGYLQSRVRLDREDSGADIAITVRIELGPIVELAFQGASLPNKQKKRARTAWHAGISDQQRPLAVKELLLAHFAKDGYLRAEVKWNVSADDNRKKVTFALQPGTQYKGVALVVEGAEAHRTREILDMLHERKLALSVYRDSKPVVEAVTGYYNKRGYLAAKVDPPRQELDEQRRTGRVVIPLTEGPVFRVGALQFSGNQALTEDALAEGVSLEAGAVFEPARLDPTLAALKLKYGKLGYPDARIEYSIARRNDRALVDVSFTIVENQQTSIGAIKVEGNRHTSEKFARSQLKVKEGEVANTSLVRESVKNLSQTGAYGSADILMQPPAVSGAGDKKINVADLVVAVTEPKPFRLLYGGLYDSGNGPGFIADFQNHNSLGAGRVLGLRTRVDSETDEARLYLTRPFWRQKRLSTTFATYFTRQTEYHQSTPTEKLGVSIQQDIQLRSRLVLSYGYRFERQRGFIPDPAAPDIPESVVSVAPATITISRDTRDSFLDATRGSFVSHGFELAPRFLGSDYPYVRYYLQYFKYFALTRPRPVPFGEQAKRSRLIFASGFRAGVQKGFNETGAVLTDRFYAGGGTTVRGFKQDELGPKLASGEPAGGNAVLVLNQELRYPLFWIFDAVTFVDFGNVFPRVSDFRIRDLRSAGGFGLRLRNPFVVLRFDYGFKFNRRPGETMGAFFFSIGQAF